MDINLAQALVTLLVLITLLLLLLMGYLLWIQHQAVAKSDRRRTIQRWLHPSNFSTQTGRKPPPAT
jgi:uncharacterized iron-regulated membrane protein